MNKAETVRDGLNLSPCSIWGCRSDQIGKPRGDRKERVWLLAPLLFVISGVLVASGGAGLVRYLYPAFAAAIAVVLYRRAPLTYMSFVWWLWFLSPFVRRVVDYRSGWVDPSPILLAPPMATLACFPILFRRESELWRRTARPFLLALGSTLYGLCIGYLKVPPKALLVASLSWFTPIIFGFYIYCTFKESNHTDDYVRTIQKAFRWGVLTMGAYGVVQLLTAPDWDAQWMINSQMGSIGTPEPLNLRVFSTMNSPGPLAVALVAGLLLMMGQRGLWVWLASVVGYLCLFFSMARSAWLSWLVGFSLLALKNRAQAGKVILVLTLVTACFLLLLPGTTKDSIYTRLQSFGDLQSDSSYQDRQNGYGQMVTTVLSDPLGVGLGGVDLIVEQHDEGLGARDSGVLEIVLSLGWCGGAVYLSALGLILTGLFGTGRTHPDFYLVATSISVAVIAELLLGSIMREVSGVVLWGFAGICLGLRYEGGKRGSNS